MIERKEYFNELLFRIDRQYDHYQQAIVKKINMILIVGVDFIIQNRKIILFIRSSSIHK